MKQKTVCKFDIKDMLPIGLTFVVLGIGLTYGLDVIIDVRDDFTSGTSEYNASDQSVDAIGEITDKLPTIATVIVAAIIIGILVRYLMVRYS